MYEPEMVSAIISPADFGDFLLVAQAAFLIHLLVRGGRISQTVNAVLEILSFLTALHIVSKRDKAAYKTAWVLLILLFRCLADCSI